MSINNKRSYTEYTVTQPTTDFAIGFDDFDEGGKDNILVTLNGVLVESLGYAAIRKNESAVSITPAITEGTVRLTRETDIDEPFHKFTAGALFSAKSMDENFQQVRHSQQEVRDGFVFLEYNTNGIVQASKEATAQAKAATVTATASAVRAETAADTAVQAVGSLQGVVDAATTATAEANTATATATTAASQATAATTTAQNAASAATIAKQEAAAAAANANAATVDTLAATGRANEAADVVADLVVGKVRAQDVSTVDGSTQAAKNTEFRNELDAIPFEDGVLPTTKASYLNTAIGAVNRVLHDKLEDSVSVADFGADPAKPDNYQAFFDCFNAFPDRAALDITIPIGTYKLSKTLYVTRPHTIRGLGGLENPMSVLDFTGAALDDNNGIKGGLWFHHSSNPHVTLPAGQVGDYGAGAIVSGVGVIKSSSDGFVINAPITLNDSFGYNNGREGAYLYGGTQGGNANHTNISRCKFAVNGGSGIKAEGSDGNTFTVTGCALMNNSEYGFNDQSLLGGVVIGCEADGNALANYNMRGGAQDNSGLGASPSRTAFIACYSESHPIANYSLNATGLVIGGTGASADSGTAIMGSLAGFILKTLLESKPNRRNALSILAKGVASL